MLRNADLLLLRAEQAEARCSNAERQLGQYRQNEQLLRASQARLTWAFLGLHAGVHAAPRGNWPDMQLLTWKHTRKWTKLLTPRLVCSGPWQQRAGQMTPRTAGMIWGFAALSQRIMGDALYEIIDAGIKPRAAHFAAIISSCAPGKDTERAERWLFRMRALEVGADPSVYHALMRVAAEAGNSAAAEQWMNEAWEEGFQPDRQSFEHLLRSLRTAGDTVNVEMWFERLMETRAI
eukprot:s80_g33.t1